MARKAAPMTEMVAAVRKFAMEHYEENGWDVLVEAMDDEEVAGVIIDASSKSAPGAITACRLFCKVRKAYADEIMATAF